jgi:hypothetical protein
MCTYGVSVTELKDILWACLDSVEGDFSRCMLHEALEMCKDYSPVSGEDAPPELVVRLVTSANKRQGRHAKARSARGA